MDLSSEVTLLADPTILFTRDEWCDYFKIEKTNLRKKDVLLFFLNEPSSTAIDYIKKFKAKNKCNLVALGYKYEIYDKLDVYYYDGDPRVFLESIFCSMMVMTDSFHATLFSLLSKTPFWTFEREYTHGQNQSARVIDLLSECHMVGRFDKPVVDEWNRLDFSAFDKWCEEKRKMFDAFLRMVCEER